MAFGPQLPAQGEDRLVDQAEAVKEFFESDRTGDPDTGIFFALTALKA